MERIVNQCDQIVAYGLNINDDKIYLFAGKDYQWEKGKLMDLDLNSQIWPIHIDQREKY